MKKLISILMIALFALFLLPAGVLAADGKVVMSPQNLRVDGKLVECEKYNIDGSNYFKLRDIAMVLDGTGSQFSVGWDEEKKVISVVTGEGYTPNGSELDLSGGDKSASAAPSTQTLLINGEVRSDLSAYNIGGNNYFKLRDLGDALGFHVDYDKPSNTAIVISYAWSWPTPWLTQEYIYNQDGAATSHSVVVYDESGRQLSYLSESEYGSESYAYAYDELGRWKTQEYTSVYDYDGDYIKIVSTTEYEYDIWGNLSKEVCQSTGDVVTETAYTYDDHGNLLISETLNNAGSSAIYHSYDENDREIKTIFTEDGTIVSVNEYTFDAEGNIIRSVSADGDGTVVSRIEYVYTDGRCIEETDSYGDDVYFYAYTYDEAGNVIHIESQTPFGSSITDRVFDGEGREVQCEDSYDGGSSLQVWTYDEHGLQVKYERTDSDGYYASDVYTYDEDGNILTDIYVNGGFKRSMTYTYDIEARKVSCLVLLEYNGEG